MSNLVHCFLRYRLHFYRDPEQYYNEIGSNIEYTMNFVFLLSIVSGNKAMMMYVICIPHEA